MKLIDKDFWQLTDAEKESVKTILPIKEKLSKTIGAPADFQVLQPARCSLSFFFTPESQDEDALSAGVFQFCNSKNERFLVLLTPIEIFSLLEILEEMRDDIVKTAKEDNKENKNVSKTSIN